MSNLKGYNVVISGSWNYRTTVDAESKDEAVMLAIEQSEEYGVDEMETTRVDVSELEGSNE